MATSNKNFKVKNGLDVNGEITASAIGGDEGGQLNLAKPLTGTSLVSNVSIDIYQNKIRIFDSGGSTRGAYIDLSAAATGVGSNLLAGESSGAEVVVSTTAPGSPVDGLFWFNPTGSGALSVWTNEDWLDIALIADVSALDTLAQGYADNALASAEDFTDARIGDVTVDGTAGNTVTARIASAVSALVDSSPSTLNTLNELAAALNDDPSFATTVSTSLGTKLNKSGDTMTGDLTLAGAPTINLHAANKQYVDSSIGSVTSAFEFADGEILGDLVTINASLENKQDKVTGVSDIEIGYLDGVTSSIQAQFTNKQDVVGNVSDTEIGYLDGVTSAIQTQINSKQDKVAEVSDTEIGYLNGVASAIQPQLDNKQDKVVGVSDSEIGHLNGVTSAIQTQIDAKLDSGIASGIYAPLNNPTFGGTVSLPLTTSIGDVSSTEISYVNGVTSAIQTQIDAKAPLADPTFTGTVSGITSSMVGLGNVDNTSDANKPISTATQSALDAKASLSGATFTANVEVDGNLVVDGNLTVNGTEFIASATSITIEDNLIQIAHQNAANTVDLGLVVGYNDGTAQHSGIVRDVSANTWKLFKGVETEPATTVDFGEGSLDDLELNNVKAAGVVFTDGTQTKVGVPSLSTFVEKTASYTIDTLSLRDGIVEMNSSSATTFTIPTDAALAWPVGASMDIIGTGTGEGTIVGDTGVTLNRTPGNKLRTQWSSATILKRGTDSWILYGDLKA